jgi:DNA mismatch repair protein MutS
MHLSVYYDDEEGKLVYNRTLQEGQGNTLYGLEVCKSLMMGEDFIKLANNIRREVMDIPDEILPSKKSIYNSQKYMDVCEICKKPAMDTHHIQEQHLADKEGYIGAFHKNALHNLMALCKKCHLAAHKGEIEIMGYKQTSHGIEPNYKKKSPLKQNGNK